MSDSLLMMAGPLFLIHVFYAIALVKQDFSVIDIGWGLGFVVVSSLGVFLSSFSLPLENLIFILATLWGLRLSLFLFLRNKGRPEDYRYQDMRQRWGKTANRDAYFKVFLLQYFLMLVVALPLFGIHFSQPHKITTINILGAILALIGLLWESVADAQKSSFKKVPGNEKKICQKGLWNLSRHPNYFGEILFWYGVFVAGFNKENLWAIIGPLFIHFLLLKVSGVPLIEKKHLQNEAYDEYKKTTPTIVPDLSKLISKS